MFEYTKRMRGLQGLRAQPDVTDDMLSRAQEPLAPDELDDYIADRIEGRRDLGVHKYMLDVTMRAFDTVPELYSAELAREAEVAGMPAKPLSVRVQGTLDYIPSWLDRCSTFVQAGQQAACWCCACSGTLTRALMYAGTALLGQLCSTRKQVCLAFSQVCFLMQVSLSGLRTCLCSGRTHAAVPGRHGLADAPMTGEYPGQLP